MTTGAVLFAGGGVGEALLGDLVDVRWAVEYDPAIAEVYRRNYGDRVIVGDVCDQDYTALPRVDWLHASPVCTRASVANSGATESDLDMRTALATVRALEAVQPRVFTLENVWPYREFQAFRRICQALDALGYWYEYSHLNSADHGVPQTRRRLILRATRDRLLPTLPEPVPWVGWYAAIEDLIPTLPETQFAEWQLARLPEEIRESVLVNGDNTQQEYSEAYVRAETPARTIRAGHGPRAFIVDGTEMREDGVSRFDGEPMFTVKAAHWKGMPKAYLVSNAATEYSDGLRGDGEGRLAVTQQQNGRLRALLVDGQPTDHGARVTTRPGGEPAFTTHAQAGSRHAVRAWLAHGRVVKITPRALARFQSLPNSYWLPEKASLATRVIGNGVPSLLMRRVLEQLI